MRATCVVQGICLDGSIAVICCTSLFWNHLLGDFIEKTVSDKSGSTTCSVSCDERVELEVMKV